MQTISENIAQPMRSPWSFMGSVCLHCWMLLWIALSPHIPMERPKSIYEREIQPNENKIVWYKFADKLPDVKPAETQRLGPPRAKARFEQNIAAGAKDIPRPPQLILAPAPEIAPSKVLPLPNIVALAPPPRIVRPFLPPPPVTPPPVTTPPLPDAPKVAAVDAKPADLKVKAPRATRQFTPPPNAKVKLPADPGSLPDAPRVAAVEPKAVTLDVKAPRIVRQFNPPPSAKLPLPTTPGALPEAPQVAAVEPKGSALDVKAPRAFRQFTPPAAKTNHAVENAAVAPPPPPITSAAALPAENSLVIAGLNPTRSAEVPTPPGSVKASFSGGPKPAPKGGDNGTSDAMIEVPSLTIQGGAKTPQPPVMIASLSPTSPAALAAAVRSVRPSAPIGGAENPLARRVANVPDPRMRGHQVYSMAIQIPNLTSYSGSWLVWFAEHESDIGNSAVEIHPPLPLNMVSPRYVPSAALDRIQGRVRLWAVIGKDGHVSEVSLIQHLDDRLDRSAAEALTRWQFRPAVRNGVPIDVDAVFEVPFYLAPKTER